MVFHQCLKENSTIMLLCRPWQLPFTSFPIHKSFTLLFTAIKSEILIALLKKTGLIGQYVPKLSLLDLLSYWIKHFMKKQLWMVSYVCSRQICIKTCLICFIFTNSYHKALGHITFMFIPRPAQISHNSWSHIHKLGARIKKQNILSRKFAHF